MIRLYQYANIFKYLVNQSEEYSNPESFNIKLLYCMLIFDALIWPIIDIKRYLKKKKLI